MNLPEMTLTIFNLFVYSFLVSVTFCGIVSCYYMISYGLEEFESVDFVIMYIYYPTCLFTTVLFVFYFLSVTLVPQGQDYYVAGKMQRRDDFAKKTKGLKKDEARHKLQMEKKQKAQNERRRSLGRRIKEAADQVAKDLVPEGMNYTLLHDDCSDPPFYERESEESRPWSRVESASSALNGTVVDALDSVLCKFDDHDDMPTDVIVSACTKLMGFLGPLFTCKSKADIARVVIAASSQHVSPGAIANIRKYMKEGDFFQPEERDELQESEDSLRPEGLFSMDIEKLLTGLRDSSVQLRFLPLTKAIMSTMMLMIVSGMKPSAAMSDGKMSDVFEVWESKIVDTLSFKNLTDCIAEIFEFSVQVVRAIKNGESVKNFILPNTLHKQYAAIMPMEQVMLDNALETQYGVTTGQFGATVDELLENMEFALAKSKSSHERTIYTRYCLDLRRLRKRVGDFVKNHSFKMEPYMLSIFGESGLAKSSLVQIFINTYSQVLGREIPDSQIAYVAGISNFDDGVTNATEIVVADDIANIVPSEAERNSSFLAQIIRIGNNTPAMTRQAELTMKGQHFWRNGLTLATTNVQNLLAHTISKKPYSLVRRFQHIEIFVKEEFRVDGKHAIDVNKVAHVKGSAGEILAPMHLVQRFHFEETGSAGQLKRVNDGSPIPFPDFLKIFAEEVQDKRVKQTRYINSLQRMKDTEHCDICFAPKAPGWCKHVHEEMQPESVAMVSHLATSGLHQSFYWLTNLVMQLHIPSFFPLLENYLGLVTMIGLAFMVGGNHIQFERLELKALWYSMGFVLLSAGVFFYSFYISFRVGLFVWSLWLIFSMVLGSVGIARAVFRHVSEDIRRRCRPQMDVNPVLRGVAYMGTIMCAVKLALSLRNMYTTRKPLPEGNLMPKSRDDFEARNAESSEWDRPTIQKAYPFDKCMTMTHDQAIDRLSASVWRFEIEGNGKKSIGSVLFLTSQLCVIAEHSWEKIQTMDLEVTKMSFFKRVDQLGENFSTYIVNHANILSDDKKSDHVILKLSSSPSMPHILDFFPEHKNHRCSFSMVFRDEDGELSYPISKYNSGFYKVSGLCGSWKGSKHTLSSSSAAGNCSSPAVSRDKPHHIVGLHSAGSLRGNTAVTFCVTRAEVQSAIDSLRFGSMEPEGVDIYPVALTSAPNLSPYGEVKATLFDEAPERAAVNWCPENGRTMVTFFGDDPHARISPSSTIRNSMMKPLLEEAGCDVNFGPPQFNSNRTHSTYLNLRRTAMKDIPPSIVKMAVSDYLDPILEKIEELGIKNKSFLPLDEVLNGRKGARFIGPINESTSAGFGLKGKKDRYLDISYDPKDNGRKIIAATPIVSDRFDAMMRQYASGCTNGIVLRSALKDEAVKYDPATGRPAKVDRLFMSCGMADVFCQKAMLGEVAQVLQSMPLLSELAVGINSTTDEWDQVYQHIIAWNPDGVMEGDFSKYDVRESGQLMRAAGYIFLRIAEAIGYSSYELSAMEAMIQESVNNYRLFGGSLISIDGWMSSGIWQTLIGNGVGNAIAHRCGFYLSKVNGKHVFQRYQPGKFCYRELVHSIFQGDDSLSATRDVRFNMRVMKAFCDEYGMVYTAGDKKSEIVDFVPADMAKFCKRGFYFHPKIGMRVGNLAVESLIKSLCTYTSSVTSEETVLTETMDANLRELARHPVEVFEKYRAIYDGVVSELGIRNLVKYIDRTYDEWWEVLGKVYRGEVEARPAWEPELLSLETLLDA